MLPHSNVMASEKYAVCPYCKAHVESVETLLMQAPTDFGAMMLIMIHVCPDCRTILGVDSGLVPVTPRRVHVAPLGSDFAKKARR